MPLNLLRLKDKPLFERYLSYEERHLSAYAFENILIWQGLYEISWAKIDESLCVFFKDNIGCFLYLPPLGRQQSKEIIDECFKMMNRFNKNKNISRIENVEESEIDCYKRLGFRIILGSCDYICKREELVNLRGNSFKQKRSTLNYFIKKYKFTYEKYKQQDKNGCIALYKLWMDQRKQKYSDPIYQRLLEDIFLIFKTMLQNYPPSQNEYEDNASADVTIWQSRKTFEADNPTKPKAKALWRSRVNKGNKGLPIGFHNDLNFKGRIIRIAGEIKALTFGYPLSKNSFVVLFEVCDLNFKGIAQYIFREFSKEQDCQDINIMDDSRLESLRRVKLSYRPYKKIKNFIAYYE